MSAAASSSVMVLISGISAINTQTFYRGLERVRSRFILTMAANNLARLPRLLGA